MWAALPVRHFVRLCRASIGYCQDCTQRWYEHAIQLPVIPSQAQRWRAMRNC